MVPASGQTPSSVWISDQGDGTHQNPVLHADYSDPDVIRAGVRIGAKSGFFAVRDGFTNDAGSLDMDFKQVL